MATLVKFLPGMTVRWRDRRYVVVDCADFDTILCREFGKRRLHDISIAEAEPDQIPDGRVPETPDLISVPKNSWRVACQKFAALKPLLAMDPVRRTRAQVSRVAKAIGKHPTTIYRWMHQYERAERVSGLLRKDRSDRGKSRLTRRLDGMIDAAIKKFYLTAENPHMTAVIEEVDLQCFKHKLKKRPHPNTIHARIAKLSDLPNWSSAGAAGRRRPSTSPSRVISPALTSLEPSRRLTIRPWTWLWSMRSTVSRSNAPSSPWSSMYAVVWCSASRSIWRSQ